MYPNNETIKNILRREGKKSSKFSPFFILLLSSSSMITWRLVMISLWAVSWWSGDNRFGDDRLLSLRWRRRWRCMYGDWRRTTWCSGDERTFSQTLSSSLIKPVRNQVIKKLSRVSRTKHHNQSHTGCFNSF